MIYPKIGIRPVIDGRQFGVREDLEQQTMDMAYAAQKLIESRLRYPDGTKVQLSLIHIYRNSVPYPWRSSR